MRRTLIAPLLVLLAACAEEGPPPAVARTPPAQPPVAVLPAPTEKAPSPVTRQLAEDTLITTASGATFTAPSGWWITQGPDAIVLEDPDRKLKETLTETPEPDPLKALEAAWQRAEPGFALKRLHEPQSPPPIRGWESQTDVDYEVRAADQRAVIGLVRRYGGTTYVATLDGDEAAVARRGAQLDTALWTFKPIGMHEESFAGKALRPLDDGRARELDGFIEQARARLDVPGAAVAVVVGGKVVYEKGFGTRELGKNEPVTPNTLFMMGSITKSMTTMMEATLVDAGKLAWDTPVTKLLPTFALGDPAVTSRLVLWNTACACTGMPRRDMELLFEYAHVTPEQRVASMQTMTPTTAFGETFQYSNLMVAAGGYAAAHMVYPKRMFNDAYDAVMHEKVFGPFGMKSTTFDFAVARRADHATPHAESIDGAVRVLPLAAEDFVTPLRPAGASWSNLRDMERYVQTEMAKGVTPEGKRVVSEANLLERRKPRVSSGELSSYALGLSVGTFRDLPVVEHDGGTFGFTTMMFMLPEQGVAVLGLTNSSGQGGSLNLAVQRKVVELLFEGARPLSQPRVDYFAKSKTDAVAKNLERIVRDVDPKWFAGLAGDYTNEGLGKVTVTAGPKGAMFDAGEWKSRLGQKKEIDGTVKAVLLDPPVAGMEFLVGGEGAHRTLTLLDEQVKYVFERLWR